MRWISSYKNGYMTIWSKNIGFLLILFIAAAVFSSCATEVEPEVEELTVGINDPEELNNILIEKRNQQLLMTDYLLPGAGRDYVQLIFEHTDTLKIQKELLVNVSADTKNWRASVVQAQAGTIRFFYLGDTILRDGGVVLQHNVYEFAPLSADIIVILQIPTNIRIEVVGKGQNGITIGKTYNNWTEQYRVPVHGLYQNTRNEVRITLLDRDGNERFSESVYQQTENYANYSMEILQNDLSPRDQALYFASDLKSGFDQQGQLRWIWTGDGQYLFRKLKNGNLLMTRDRDMVSYHAKYFVEMTLSGRIVQEFEVPNYFHHEIRELSNGNFLVATNSTPIVLGNGQKQEDTIVEIDRISGEVVRQWDFSTILDPNRLRLPGERAEDWLHMNSIWLNEDETEMMISGRAQSVVACVSYPDGDLKWILGDHGSWSNNFTSYLLSPVDDNNQPIDPATSNFWQYAQHAAMFTENGSVLLYDNGRYRDFYQNPNAVADTYSRAVEYEINPTSMTVKKVWEHNPSDPLFTPFTGDVDILPNGHRLVSFMWGSGKTPRIVEIDGNEVVFEAVINQGQNMYRAEKIYLYE